jgi:hypothetical protein
LSGQRTRNPSHNSLSGGHRICGRPTLYPQAGERELTDHAALGRASRQKGAVAERTLAKYLKTWWPESERAVVTGFRTTDRASADTGDIRGTPFVWQLKYRQYMTDREIRDAMAETQEQTQAAGAVMGFLIQRRPGKADPGKWWAWLPACDLVFLAVEGTFRGPLATTPIRVELGDLMALLVRAGHPYCAREVSTCIST